MWWVWVRVPLGRIFFAHSDIEFFDFLRFFDFLDIILIKRLNKVWSCISNERFALRILRKFKIKIFTCRSLLILEIFNSLSLQYTNHEKIQKKFNWRRVFFRFDDIRKQRGKLFWINFFHRSMRNKILSIFERNRYEKIVFYEEKNRKNHKK